MDLSRMIKLGIEIFRLFYLVFEILNYIYLWIIYLFTP